MSKKVGEGRDAFGPFNLEEGFCDSCEMNNDLNVRWYGKNALQLPAGIDVESTILKHPHRKVGINCGCYGKLHRQVAHIHDGMEMRRRVGKSD